MVYDFGVVTQFCNLKTNFYSTISIKTVNFHDVIIAIKVIFNRIVNGINNIVSILLYEAIRNKLQILFIQIILKSASNLNGNLNCSKELEHYAS